MPFLPAALSVTAMTIATSPFLPLVMNCLTPFEHVVVAVAHARVVRRPRPRCRRAARSGRTRRACRRAPAASATAPSARRCRSAMRIEQTGQLLTLTMVEVPPSPAAISSRISGEREVVEAGAAVLGRAPRRRSSRARRGPAARPAESGASRSHARRVRRDAVLHVAAHGVLHGAVVGVEDHRAPRSRRRAQQQRAGAAQAAGARRARVAFEAQ